MVAFINENTVLLLTGLNLPFFWQTFLSEASTSFTHEIKRERESREEKEQGSRGMGCSFKRRGEKTNDFERTTREADAFLEKSQKFN